MFLKIEQLQLLFIDIDTFSDDYSEQIWEYLKNSVRLIFLTTDNTNQKIQKLSLYGEIVSFYNFSNDFAIIENHNILVNKLLSYGIKSCHAAIVTKSINSLDHITGFNIRNIFISRQSDFEHAPDYLCRTTEDIISVTENILGSYYAENKLANLSYKKSSLLIKNLKCQNSLIPVFAGGRYYNRSCFQSQYHLLSNKILSNKRNGNESCLFYPLYKKMIMAYWKNNKSNTIILSVPPKPGKTNRFRTIVKKLSEYFAFIDGSDFLICPSNYGDNKPRNAIERARSLQGAFYLNQTLTYNPFSGKDVIIIDDIVTSGATIIEIGNLLLNNNASNINAFVMGINQKPDFMADYTSLLCPNCNAAMVLRMRNRDQKPFFGCQNYRNGCNQIFSFNNGILKLTELNEMKRIEEDPFEF